MVFKDITIVGLGNVGTSLLNELLHHGFDVTHVYSSKEELLTQLKQKYSIQAVSSLSEIQTDACLVCVSDDRVNEVINQIPESVCVMHTSGNTQLQNIDRKKNIGVFYPLQTITAKRQIDFKTVPFLIEASDDELKERIKQMASAISDHVLEIDSENRKRIHLAAVFINNFVNHQIYLAGQLAEQFGFDKHLLEPLLLETIHKAIDEGAYDAQTGPGRRGDVNVISAQMTMLSKDFQQVYHTLTESIIKTYNG